MDCDPFDIWQQCADPGVFFWVRGPLSQDLLVTMVDALARKMRLDDTGTATVVKVQAVLVELSQNIARYSAERVRDPDPVGGHGELGSGIVAVGCSGGGYSIASGNLMDEGQVPALRALLDEIRDQDAERLRAMFLERRRNPSASKRGAGLGFIEVARKASARIEYHIRPVSPGRAFFSIRVTV